MGLKQIAGKINKLLADRGVEPKKGLKPDEVELMYFKEKDRLAKVKRELSKYRLKDNRQALLGDDSLLQSKAADGRNIFNQRSTLTKKHKGIPSILDSKRMFFK